MIEKHLMKLRARDALSDEEEHVVRQLISETREVASKTTIICAEEPLSVSILLIEGWMCRFKDLTNGQRQITQLHIAGDFVDLHSFTLKRLDHSVMSLTPCLVGIVPHSRLLELSYAHPHLMRLCWLMTNIDAALHREWELCLGRRTAIARLAHILCELRARLGVVGLGGGAEFPFPLTQQELSECTGLTPVHVNRTLKELRGRNIVEVRHGKVLIHDQRALEAIADFNPTYLYLDREPR